MSYKVLAEKVNYFQNRVRELQQMNEQLVRMLIAKDLELTKFQREEPEPPKQAPEPLTETQTEPQTEPWSPDLQWTWSPQLPDSYQ